MLRLLTFLLVCLFGSGCAVTVKGGLEISQLADNVYLHTSYKDIPGYGLYPSNGLVVIDGKSAYIIDTPWPEPDTLQLLAWIKDSGFTPKASIATHFHEDRSSGIAALNQQNIATHASHLTNQKLDQNGAVKAAFEFRGPGFSLLEDKIQVFYPGPGHTEDNVVVWLDEQKILFGGCLVRALSTQTMGNTADASLDSWAGSVQNLMDEFGDINQVIPGHGEPGGIELLWHTKELAHKTADPGPNDQ